MHHKNELEKLKNQLETESSDLEKEIKEEFSVIKSDASKKIRNTLLITGGSLAVFATLKILLSDKKKVPENGSPKRKKRKSFVASRIKSVMVTLLLELAKKKLVEFLNEKADDSKSD